MTVKFKISRQSARAAKCDESFLGVFFLPLLYFDYNYTTPLHRLMLYTSTIQRQVSDAHVPRTYVRMYIVVH